MYNMKEANIRHLQHHLSEVIDEVEHGEEVVITRRNRVIARIIPYQSKAKSLIWPDFSKRALNAVKGHAKGAALSSFVTHDRGE